MKQIVRAVWLLSALLASAFSADTDSYKGYKLYDVRPSTRAELELLHRVSSELDLDFWSLPLLDRSSSVMVSPWNEDSFTKYLREHNVRHRLLHNDVQSENFSNQIRARTCRSIEKADERATFDYFWTLDEIYKYMEYLRSKYPNLVYVKDYGRTHEDRPIKIITISTNGNVTGSHPVVLIDAGIQAREWAGHMSVIYLIHQLVERSTDNLDLLRNTDWVIMPVANPDGYVYTHEKNRFWSKNRSPTSLTCNGTDLSRNFPFRWKHYGDECSTDYAGHTPGSELETRALMQLMAKCAPVTEVYLSVQSCGNSILYPYGYDNVEVPNKAELQELGEKATRAVRAINGPEYTVGSAAALHDPANGRGDYIYGSLGVEYVYGLKLSCGATSGQGFMISSEEMQTINREAFEMFKVFGKFAGQKDFRKVPNRTWPGKRPGDKALKSR
ncbi:carboxypeptidase B1-like [Ochlerotatus camptorhynchus]|uniref:carboxypeptidase B1-like n=1 Tax=Ochlerotatus camptorhynchus TaxID=644619 RepID=UPI0031E100A6